MDKKLFFINPQGLTLTAAYAQADLSRKDYETAQIATERNFKLHSDAWVGNVKIIFSLRYLTTFDSLR